MTLSYNLEFNTCHPHLDGFICIHDNWDEDTEHNVDKKADKNIEVDAAVPPGVSVSFGNDGESVEHVIAVEEGEETLGGGT